MDLHQRALPHVKLCEYIAAGRATQACPAVESESVRLTIGPFWVEQNFLVVAVTRCIRLTVNVDGCFGVAEIACLAQGKI